MTRVRSFRTSPYKIGARRAFLLESLLFMMSLSARVSSGIHQPRPPRASDTPRDSNSSSRRTPATCTSKSVQRTVQRARARPRAPYEPALPIRERGGCRTHPAHRATASPAGAGASPAPQAAIRCLSGCFPHPARPPHEVDEICARDGAAAHEHGRSSG